MIDYILGEWRRTRQHAHLSSGNAWLVYERAYNDKEKKFPSMREINRAWGGKPSIYNLNRLAKPNPPRSQ